MRRRHISSGRTIINCFIGDRASRAIAPPLHRSFAANSHGDTIYQEYLELQARLKSLREEQERTKSEKMYAAWQRAEKNGPKPSEEGGADDEDEKQKNPMAGVLVVKTLVKEQRRSKSSQENVEELHKQALVKLHEAAQSHHPSALVQLGNLLLNNEPQKSLEYYRMAGEVGSAEGWFNLGHCLWEGSGTVSSEPEIEQAMEAFRKAIELGDHDAMYFVGVQSLSQVEHDEELADDNQHLHAELIEGLRLVEKAAAFGHGRALHYLALLHLNGHKILQIRPCSKEDFVQHLNAAVEHDGSGDALFLRGSCYYSGDTPGFERDTAKALADFLQAADLGHADAAVSAGAILHKGDPRYRIVPDQQRAFALYQHAGELGSEDGWRNVVACYLTGEGVPQNTETAKYIAKTMLSNRDF